MIVVAILLSQRSKRNSRLILIRASVIAADFRRTFKIYSDAIKIIHLLGEISKLKTIDNN